MKLWQLSSYLPDIVNGILLLKQAVHRAVLFTLHRTAASGVSDDHLQL